MAQARRYNLSSKTLPDLFLLDPDDKAYFTDVPHRFLTLNHSGILAVVLLLIMLLPLYIAGTGISQLVPDLQLASSGVTTQAQVTSHRTVAAGGRSAALTYFVTYRFT